MTDARFEDGAERPLRLRAETLEDLAVISALVQDAVCQPDRIAWMPRRHRFTLLINRFRWEDRPAAERQRRPFERIQSLLTVDSAMRARTSGVDPSDRELVMAVLSIAFEPTEDGGGRVRIVLAGDGEIVLDVECLDVSLVDVTRPYVARARRAPAHPSE